jgi:hypothetical protein
LDSLTWRGIGAGEVQAGAVEQLRRSSAAAMAGKIVKAEGQRPAQD